jgi:hypothetical protein
MNAINPLMRSACRLSAILLALRLLAWGACRGSHTVAVIREEDLKGNPHLASYRWPTAMVLSRGTQYL